MYQTSTDLHSIIVQQFDPMKVKKKNRTEQEERKQEAQIGSNCRTITEFKSVLASCFLSSCSVLVFFFLLSFVCIHRIWLCISPPAFIHEQDDPQPFPFSQSKLC